MDRLTKLLNFVKLTNGFKNIERDIPQSKDRIKVSSIVAEYFYLIIKAIQNNIDLSSRHPVIFEKAITYNNERYDIHHTDVEHFNDIPDNLKLKAHAVCMHNGKMLLVHHPEWDIWSLPGGTRDNGEIIEETLKREIREETNCKVVDYYPIAFQKIISPTSDKHYYRLQYLCNVVPLGNFEKDPAGNINKIIWIEPNKFEEYIENKEFKRVVIRRALEVLKNYEDRKN